MVLWHGRSLALFALLAGCATASQWSHFERPGTTELEFQRDQNECFAQSIDGTSQERGGLIRVNRDAYRRCMEERGYTFG
jgi:hypothetical protein